MNAQRPDPHRIWREQPPDPDIVEEVWPPFLRRSPRRRRAETLAVIAAGGVLGTAARYAAGLAWPVAATGFPWTTLAVNVTGCFLMGVLMVLVTELREAHPLVRPFLGTGVLGGFTTFSTVMVDTQRLTDHGLPQAGLLALLLTLAGALAAVWSGVMLTRILAGEPPIPTEPQGPGPR